MTSLSHWGMFDIDQMYRDVYPPMTFVQTAEQVFKGLKKLGAKPIYFSEARYQHLNFGPDID